jgi:hypothetical protein
METDSAAPVATAVPGYSFWTMFLSGVALSLWSAVPWTVLFLFIRWTGLRLYVLNDRDVCRRIQRRVTNTSHMSDDGKSYGYAVGRWYLMDISIENNDGDITYCIWMIATTASHKRLTADLREASEGESDSDEEGTKKTKPLLVYERNGCYTNLWYRERKVGGGFEPRDEQTAILTAVTELVTERERGHATVFLHGPPGTGKSMIGVLLAETMGGVYCNTLKPWEPGDTLGSLHSQVEPSAEKPLIVCFDEFDGPLMAIHGRSIERHKNIPTAVADKEGWNRFLDEISRGMFPHTILLLTSNRGPEFVRALDPSYIREGRVDLVLHLAPAVADE